MKSCKNCKYADEESYGLRCFGQKNAPTVLPYDSCVEWKPKEGKEITIKISDYLSDEEIKQIAIETLRYKFSERLNNEANIERVLSNLSHAYVFKAVCDHLSVDLDEIQRCIQEGVEKALDVDTIKYKVFKRRDAWERTESPAVAILDSVLKDCLPKIEEIVNQRIEEYPFFELTEDEIGDTIYHCIMDKLFDTSRKESQDT